MRSIILCFFPLVAASFIDKFEEWVHDFRVKFRDLEHQNSVYSKWLSNDKFINEINGRNLTYTLGHNHFSGMDSDEFRNYLGYYIWAGDNERVRILDLDVEYDALPKEVDWVKNGAVTAVKDQSQCGSCWSFSTTGALEGAYFNKYGKLESFSEQQLVDCDTYRNGGRDHGCKGGLMDNAFTWIEKNGGLCSESDYPYVSGTTKTEGTCQNSCDVDKNSHITGFIDVLPSSDEAMMSALAKQPVSIAIEADQKEFQLYKSGVFTGTCGTNLDHGVLAVGYGSLSGVDYYKVKNSWSSSWGQDGYILLGRGEEFNKGDGQCGMLLSGSYPQL
jgi:C1A family cysteine protease